MSLSTAIKANIKLIENEYSRLDGANDLARSTILYNIIMAKKHYKLLDQHQSLYVDIKQWIITIFERVDTQDYGYDQLLFNKVLTVMGDLSNEQQDALCLLIKRHLILSGYEENDIHEILRLVNNNIDLRNHNYLSMALRYTSNSYWWLLIFCALYVLLIFGLMHPAWISSFELFEVKLYQFTDSSQLNYLLNTLAYVWGDEHYCPIVTPLCLWAMMVIGLIKLFAYVFLGNFVIQKIVDLFDLRT